LSEGRAFPARTPAQAQQRTEPGQGYLTGRFISLLCGNDPEEVEPCQPWLKTTDSHWRKEFFWSSLLGRSECNRPFRQHCMLFGCLLVFPSRDFHRSIPGNTPFTWWRKIVTEIDWIL